MPTFLVSLIVWGTLATVAVVAILSSDLISSLTQLGCLINGTCNSNS